MKATIDFDDALYKRLKIEAAKRGRTIRDLVTDGVKHILEAPLQDTAGAQNKEEWRPAWLGTFREHADRVEHHDMASVRSSITRKRRPPR